MSASTASQVAQGQGVFLTGEFFSIGEPREPYTDRRGIEHHPVSVTLAVNGNPVRVEMELGQAQDLVSSTLRGDVVTLPVFVDGPWDEGTRRFGSVRFRAKPAA